MWTGSVYIHSYNSESGNSHLVYKKERVVVDIASGKYSSKELIKVSIGVSAVLAMMIRNPTQNFLPQDPSLFARQTSAMISEKERSIQSRLCETVSQFKSKYIKKLRRILPINPVKFDWGRSYSSLQDPLNESILTNTSL